MSRRPNAVVDQVLLSQTLVRGSCPSCGADMVNLGTHCNGEYSSDSFAACLACMTVAHCPYYYSPDFEHGPSEPTWEIARGASRDPDNYSDTASFWPRGRR